MMENRVIKKKRTQDYLYTSSYGTRPLARRRLLWKTCSSCLVCNRKEQLISDAIIFQHFQWNYIYRTGTVLKIVREYFLVTWIRVAFICILLSI
jgi:hypothetical protein